MIHSRFPLVAAVASALLLPLTGYSLGSRIPDQDAEATARGGAFTATADNPSAIYYNPAGIMQMDGLTSLISGYGILIHEHYDPLKGDKVNHQTTNEQKLQGVPQSYYVYHPKGKPFAVGLGIYTPFGFSLEYPDNTSFRQEGLYGSVEFITVNPVLAVQVTRSLSIGIGVSVNYINAELRQGLTPSTGDLFSFKGDGFAVGANAGILWKPTPRQAIGLSYHSPVEGDLSGHTSAHLNGSELRASEAGNRQIAAGRQALAGRHPADQFPAHSAGAEAGAHRECERHLRRATGGGGRAGQRGIPHHFSPAGGKGLPAISAICDPGLFFPADSGLEPGGRYRLDGLGHAEHADDPPVRRQQHQDSLQLEAFLHVPAGRQPDDPRVPGERGLHVQREFCAHG